MIDGIINVYKEEGYTSHDVVAKLRGILHQKKIGHTGTLDPAATGVLPVCCGRATKVCELLTDRDKTYQAVCRLGVVTDTQDMTGKVLEERSTGHLEPENIKEAVLSFQGESMQIPPMYSALKVNGKKLYELAREGVCVERNPRPIRIDQIEILQMNLEQNTFLMEVTCSKGTYIRTLCHDIGQKLQVGAALEHLVRTRVDVFPIEEALTLAEITKIVEEGDITEKVIPVDSLFPGYPRLQIREEFARKLANGNLLKPEQLQSFEAAGTQAERRQCFGAGTGQDEKDGWKHFLVYDQQGQFKAIYQEFGDSLSVVKMF